MIRIIEEALESSSARTISQAINKLEGIIQNDPLFNEGAIGINLIKALRTVNNKVFKNCSKQTTDDVVAALTTLAISFQTIDKRMQGWGVGQMNPTVLIPPLKCKEFLALSDAYQSCDDIKTDLYNIYDGASALRDALATTTNEGWAQVDLIHTDNELAKWLIQDTTCKVHLPWGSKGRYENYVQYVTSSLTFSESSKGVSYSKLGSNKSDYDVLAANGQKIEVKNGTEGTFVVKISPHLNTTESGDRALQALNTTNDGYVSIEGGSVVYFDHGETLVIFNNDKAYVVYTFEGLKEITLPVQCDSWEVFVPKKKIVSLEIHLREGY